MTLENDVKKEIIAMGNHAAAFKSGKYDPSLAQLVLQYSGDMPDELRDPNLLRQLDESQLVEIIAKNGKQSYSNLKSNLIGAVESGYKPILEELDGLSLISLLQIMPAPEKVDEKYEKLKQSQESFTKYRKMFEKKDIKSYKEGIKNSVAKQILGMLNEESVLKYLERRVGIEQAKFYSQLTNKPRELMEALEKQDGDAINKYLDTEKLKGYLESSISSLKPEEKESIYESIGITYSNYKLKQEEIARDKKVKKALA